MKLAYLLPLLTTAGCVAPVSLDGRPCPCATGWTCNTTTHTCVAQSDAGSDGPSGGSDAPSGGMDAGTDGPTGTLPHDVTITEAPGDPSNATTPTFRFTSPDPDAAFACDLDGAGFTPCTSPVTLPPVTDGEHTFTVRATHTAGDPTFDHRTWTVDSQPPSARITSGPGAFSNVASPTFVFSTSADAQIIECDLDGAGFAPCTSPHTLSPVPDGDHTFTIRATDAAGNSGVLHQTWTVDTIAPSAMIVDGPSPVTNLSIATFAFNADEEAVVFACDLDGAGFAPCTSPDTLPPVSDGEHTFTVRATDAAGNPAFDHRTWTVDSQPPSVIITSGPPSVTRQPIQTIAFMVSGATHVECQVDAQLFAPCSSPFSTPALPDGGHLITVRASDDAGNPPAIQVRSFTVDTTPPVIHVVPVHSPTGVSPVIQFFVTDATPSTTQCQVDDGAFASCGPPFMAVLLDNGSHTVTVRASDEAGNTGSDATTFTVSAPVYHHTIQIDGGIDFLGAELLDTTSDAGVLAYLAWDDAFVYLGSDTTLIGDPDPTRSLVFYLDIDPGAGTGAGMGAAAAEPFGTQAATFPAGFRADYALRWTTDGALTFKQFDGTAWQAMPPTGVVAASRTRYVEFAVPRALIGGPPRIGLLGLWQLSGGFAERTLGGWYVDSFVDGDYRAANPVAIRHWLRADFASAVPPIAPGNKR